MESAGDCNGSWRGSTLPGEVRTEWSTTSMTKIAP